MYRIAVDVAALPGATLEARLEQAAKAGFDGVEFDFGETAAVDVRAAGAALRETGLVASSVRVGHTRLIHPDYNEREKALVLMRRAMSTSVDLGAAGVVFYGHYAQHHVLPDLHPYKSSIELEAELLVTQLRATLCDLAYALGTQLLLMPADRGCSSLLTRPEHALTVRARLNDHPHLQVALHTAHLAVDRLAIEHWADRECVRLIATDANASGLSDTALALTTAGFSGWLVIGSDRVLTYDELRTRAQTAQADQRAS